MNKNSFTKSLTLASLAVVAGIGVTLATATPAHADWDDGPHWHHHHWREYHDYGRGYVVEDYPPPGYYAPPRYYAPPPPVYYGGPAGLNVVIPLRFH